LVVSESAFAEFSFFVHQTLLLTYSFKQVTAQVETCSVFCWLRFRELSKVIFKTAGLTVRRRRFVRIVSSQSSVLGLMSDALLTALPLLQSPCSPRLKLSRRQLPFMLELSSRENL
jgi:hypothetical protein